MDRLCRAGIAPDHAGFAMAGRQRGPFQMGRTAGGP